MSATPQESFHFGSISNLEDLERDPANIGPWLALKDLGGKYEVVARGDSATDVYKVAIDNNVCTPVVTKIPEPDICLFL